MQPTIMKSRPAFSSSVSARSGSILSCLPRKQTGSARRGVHVRAQQKQQEKPEVAKFADSVGLPTEEGLFGFKPFPEVMRQ